jgi:predicted nucleic acid-binding protein
VPYVLDASIATSWCFRDEEFPQADLARDRLLGDRAIVPVHWWFEIRNALLTSERRKRVTEDRVSEFLKDLQALPIDIAELPESSAVLALARRHQLTFYDAAYLELAQRKEIALATLDRQLRRAASTERLELIEP